MEENRLWEAITIIEAREMILQMTIADWPNLKKQARLRKIRELHKMAFPATYNREKKYITPEQLQRRLMRGK